MEGKLGEISSASSGIPAAIDKRPRRRDKIWPDNNHILRIIRLNQL
jgi:hypothetical protein